MSVLRNLNPGSVQTILLAARSLENVQNMYAFIILHVVKRGFPVLTQHVVRIERCLLMNVYP